MAAGRSGQVEITLRLRIKSPVPGVRHALQDKAGAPVAALTADADTLTFDIPLRAGPGPRFFGPHVRSEGPNRQFFYIGIGRHAGDPHTAWDRRMKIDIHSVTEEQVAKAAAGGILEAEINGTGRDGSPACATVPLLGGWTIRPAR